jgi:hypothetical protein
LELKGCLILETLALELEGCLILETFVFGNKRMHGSWKYLDLEMKECMDPGNISTRR